MRRKKNGLLPAGLEQVRGQFERWRETRGRRGRIPERLWQAAVRVAKEHGTDRTARALRLNSASLKRRLNGTAARRAAAEASPPTFVEVDVQKSPWATQCMVELEEPDGSRLCVQISGQGTVDLVALTEAFRRART